MCTVTGASTGSSQHRACVEYEQPATINIVSVLILFNKYNETCRSTDTRLVYCMVCTCLRPIFHWYTDSQFSYPGGMARLSWPR